jgi:hypothetical protein
MRAALKILQHSTTAAAFRLKPEATHYWSGV